LAEPSLQQSADVVVQVRSEDIERAVTQLGLRRRQLAALRAQFWHRPGSLLRSLWRSPFDTDAGRRATLEGSDLSESLQLASLKREVYHLENELRVRYGELLELQTLIARQAKGGGRPGAGVSSDALELRALFGEIALRSCDNASLVTIVIPAYGKPDYTIRCLRSIATTWSSFVNPMIVIVDDASPDGSAREFIGIPHVDVLCNGANVGYLHSTNRGSALARTKYVCFLNNDTEVLPAWLEMMVSTAEADETIGAVGSKLIYPDGTLQEAGSIIWSDASGWNVGRGGDPAKSEYNFLRDVDYCSAASLLVRTDLLRVIGGFDERYAPAYYEDADLCFEVKARGFRVVYDSRSEVIHYEGISSGTNTSSGVKRYQQINQPKFADKWHDVLSTKFPPSADNVESAIYQGRWRTIIIIDSYVPMYDREAGSNRLFKIIKILRDLNYHVVFLPDNFAMLEPYTSALFGLGVEVLHSRPRGPGREEALIAALRRADVVWICRPELCEVYIPIVRRESAAPVVYDTIDLHFERERGRVELTGGDDIVWQKMKALELSMARAATLVVTVTDVERNTLRKHGISNVAVIPTIHDVEAHNGLPFELRSGIVFIGGYNHPPNSDAAIWLCKEIMPLVWRSHPDIRVTLLGSNPSTEVAALRNELVDVTGYIPDVAPYFEESRVFVAPLRYGAGMKGKIGQALSFGLPVVTTSVGAEGYELADGSSCSIADDAESFAKAIVRLYTDSTLWARCSEAGSQVIGQLGSDAVRERLVKLFAEIGLPEINRPMRGRL
jgi:GT2 family glycosyltransferase